MRKLWIDDLRDAPPGWVRVYSSEEAIYMLTYWREKNIPVEAVSFDHDLGGDDTTRPVVMWFCSMDFWPTQVFVHTANPVGREWLVGMCKRYGPGISI